MLSSLPSLYRTKNIVSHGTNHSFHSVCECKRAIACSLSPSVTSCSSVSFVPDCELSQLSPFPPASRRFPQLRRLQLYSLCTTTTFLPLFASFELQDSGLSCLFPLSLMFGLEQRIPALVIAQSNQCATDSSLSTVSGGLQAVSERALCPYLAAQWEWPGSEYSHRVSV